MTHVARTVQALLLASSLFLVPVAAFAGRVQFVKEHVYRAGDMDSKVSSRTIALQEAKRALLEQLGTYLVSETEVRNYKLTSDQISVLTAGIVSAEVLEERWDGKEYYLKAKLTVDPQEVAERVRAISNDRERTRELEESRRKTDQALREVARLKKDMGLANPDIQAQAERQADYSRAVQELGSDDWYAGFRFQMKDGSSFIWLSYEEYGTSYCTYLDDGRICVSMSDVASIRRGQYPEHAEVVTPSAASERSRKAAERDRQRAQKEAERMERVSLCDRLRADLSRLRRDSPAYQSRYDEARDVCGGTKYGSAQKRSASAAPATGKKERGREMETIMKNAKDGTVF